MNYELRCGKRDTVLFCERFEGDDDGAVERARAVLRESVDEAAECEIDAPEVSTVDVYRHNVGPAERAGWSHTLVATVRRGRKTLRYDGPQP